MKRLGLNVLAILIMVVYGALVILGNVRIAKVPVAVMPGSYAESYAIENKIPFVKVADSERYLFDTRYLTEEPLEQPEDENGDKPEKDYWERSIDKLDFQYNESDTAIEIVRYSGKDDMLVIPSHIKGKPVTSVSMDMVGKYKFVVFPETVTSITGKMTVTLLSSAAFVVGLFFAVISFFVVLIVANVVLPRFSETEEFLLSSPQIILSAMYLIAQIAVSILTTYRIVFIQLYLIIVIDMVFLILYVVLVLLGGIGRKHVNEVQQKRTEKTDFMKTFIRECQGLADGITDKEAKKQVERLVEDIRFSDKVSSSALVEVEALLTEAVDELRVAISGGDSENILVNCAKAKKALDERNRLAKSLK